MEVEIRKTLPPQYDLIKSVLNPPDSAIITVDGIIYNPMGGEIDPDIQEHEKIHIKQQRSNPDWLQKYLSDEKFREKVEVEAYAHQYKYLKEKVKVTAKDLKLFLHEMANALSKDYKLSLSYGEAEAKIRNFNKTK